MVRRKTHDEFLYELNLKYKNEYTLHEEYTNNSTKMVVEHLECRYKWSVYPSNLLFGRSKCPNCNGKRRRTSQEFCEYVLERTNNQFSSLGDFKGNNYLATFKHNSCGYIFQSIPQIVQKGEIGCRYCSNMLIHDKEHVKLLLEDKYGTEYSLLSEGVKNNRDTILIIHNVCKREFETSSTQIINSSKGCPYCNIHASKGELKIEKYLKQNSVKCIREHTFVDCRHKSVLFFDFAIFDDNDNLVGLIEFDGKQHFEPVDFFGGTKGFEDGKVRDGIKNEYCNSNGIPLLRIPYWDERNIDKITEEFINCILPLKTREVV